MCQSKNRSAGRISTAIARFFTVVYAFASLFAALHQDHRVESLGAHSPVLSASRPVAASIAHLGSNVSRCASNADVMAASDRYCALCDFVSHLVSPAALPQIQHSLHAVLVGVAAPAVRPQPYAPFRFYARSASRAPPTV